MADGSLKFDTKIDTSGLDAGISNLTNAIERLISKIDGMAGASSTAFQSAGSNAASTAQNVDKITESTKQAEKEMSGLQQMEQSPSGSKTADMDKYRAKIIDAEKEMERLLTERERLEGQILPTNLPAHSEQSNQAIYESNKEWQKLTAKIEEAALAIEKYNQAATTVPMTAQDRASVFTGTITHNDPPPSPFPEGVNYDIYGNNVDEVIEKNRQLAESSRQTASTVQTENQREAQSVVGFKDSIIAALGILKSSPSAIAGFFQGVGSQMSKSSSATRNLQDEIDRYTDALHYAEKAGLGLGDKAYDEAYAGLTRARKSADEYRRSLTGANNAQKKVKQSGSTMNRSLKQTHKTVPPLTKSILKLSNMFKLMLIRMAMRTVIQGVKEGFSNLAQYSESTNKSLSILMSALTRFKNSFATAFAPVLNVAAPALKSLIDLLSEAAARTGQLFAALSGKSTFEKAVDVEEDYAASLKDSNKELKEKEKLTLSFDDLIQASGKSEENEYKPPTPDQMFETIEIKKDIIDFAEVVKGALSGLFDPIKESWERHGAAAIESAKGAFSSIMNLAKDVGASFLQVWNTEKYGEAITSDLLITFTNFMQTISNLADAFDAAWKKGDTGTNIIRHLGDIVLEVTGFFRDASESIKSWSATLDFSPILKAFDNVLVKLTPLVNKVGQSLLWLLNSVFLPLTKWALEKAVPAALDLFAAGLDLLNSVLDALQPLALWLWEDFIQPIGKWAGEVFISALQKITEGLIKFSDWINEHQQAVEVITIAVASFFLAWKFGEFVNGVKSMILILPGLISKFATLLGGINPLILAVGAIISLAAILGKNWDAMTPTEKLISGVLAAAAAVAILAVAFQAIKGAAAVAVIGAALIAGIAAANIAISAGKSQVSKMQSSSGYSLQGVGDVSGYSIPKLATGTVVPPRAGEFAAILGDNNRETEIVSPLSTMKQALLEALAESEYGGMNNKNVQVDMYVGEQKFASTVFNLYNQEKQRVGIRMIPEG